MHANRRAKHGAMKINCPYFCSQSPAKKCISEMAAHFLLIPSMLLTRHAFVFTMKR